MMIQLLVFLRIITYILCHMVHGEGGDLGPDLTRVGRRLRPDFIKPFIRRPMSFNPDTDMPPFEGTERELDDLTRYLRSLK